MKRACIRLVLLAAALGALVAVPTDCKYITDIAPLNYNLLAVFPASIPPGQRDLMTGSPVYGNDSRGINQGRYGFDFVYYTPPVIATAGTTGGGAFAGSNGHPADTHTNSGTQLILYDCPAGWYAFKLRGGDGGFGRCWSSGDYCGAGGAGGRGATVSGYTYMEGGTIIVRAGKIGKKNSRNSSAQWGGGMAHGSAWAGAGGGYSGIFCDTSGGTTADGTTAVAIAGGGGGGGGGARVSGNGYNCRGWGGAGSGYNTADNGAGLPTAASPGPWGGRGGGGAGSGEHKDPGGRGTATGGGNDGNLGSGGGGGGGGGNRDCRDKGHIAFGGGGGVLTYNALAVPYFGKGGGGGAGYGSGEYGGNGAGEYGGWVTSGTHMGGATRGTSMSEAGGTGTGGTGGYSSGGSSGNGGGGGGGGYAGGGGGGHGSRNGGGGGGGSSYLKAEVYPLAAEASLPGLPAPWATRIPADPNVAATTDDRDKNGDSDGLITSSNGFAWIMYLGARNPNDTKPPADAEKGIDGGYTDIP